MLIIIHFNFEPEFFLWIFLKNWLVEGRRLKVSMSKAYSIWLAVVWCLWRSVIESILFNGNNVSSLILDRRLSCLFGNDFGLKTFLLLSITFTNSVKIRWCLFAKFQLVDFLNFVSQFHKRAKVPQFSLNSSLAYKKMFWKVNAKYMHHLICNLIFQFPIMSYTFILLENMHPCLCTIDIDTYTNHTWTKKRYGGYDSTPHLENF